MTVTASYPMRVDAHLDAPFRLDTGGTDPATAVIPPTA